MPSRTTRDLENMLMAAQLGREIVNPIAQGMIRNRQRQQDLSDYQRQMELKEAMAGLQPTSDMGALAGEVNVAQKLKRQQDLEDFQKEMETGAFSTSLRPTLERAPKAFATPTKGSQGSISESDQRYIDEAATAVREGRMAPSQVGGGWGALGQIIRRNVNDKILEQEPSFNFQSAELNYKARGSTGAIQSVQLAKAVSPLMDTLKDQAKKLPQEVMGINWAPLTGLERRGRGLAGNTDVIAFQTTKNKLVEEFERMLTGSQMADSRVQRNLAIIHDGWNANSIATAVDELQNVLGARVRAVSSDMYPLQGQAGGQATPQSSPSSSSVNPNDPWGLLKK